MRAVSGQQDLPGYSLEELVAACRHDGRSVPASVVAAVDALWRWAACELTPRPRRSLRLSGVYADTPLPLDLREHGGRTQTPARSRRTQVLPSPQSVGRLEEGHTSWKQYRQWLSL
jgi:hypothetical protein